MAAPYVAGASVIIREAMEFVGYTNITQDTIYDHMMATADSFLDDEATGQWYSRLNLEAAVDALMPADDYGSTIATAYDLGTVSDPTSISGLIGTLDDIDYFTFTAGSTGRVTFTASNMTHELEAAWSGTGLVSGSSNETYTIDVAAGQTYTVGFSSAGGSGYYDLDITNELPVAPSADFDSNSLIDGFDFLAWQRGFGITAPNATKADGDADNDLDVDANDLGVWESQYGTAAPAVAAVSHLSPQLVDLAMVMDKPEATLDTNRTEVELPEPYLEVVPDSSSGAPLPQRDAAKPATVFGASAKEEWATEEDVAVLSQLVFSPPSV